MNLDEAVEFGRTCPWKGGVVHIYALIDPETLEARYIGKSVRPAQRFENHCNKPKSNCHRSHWIQSLKRRGLRPMVVILETIIGAWPWQEAERFWIAHGRRLGWPLTNNTSGGDGVPDLPPETRAKMAAVWKGRKHKPETIEKLRAASSGRIASAATRAKMSASQAGRVITWGNKISEATRKFSIDDAAAIVQRLSRGERVVDLSREFGVSRVTISKIKKGVYFDKYGR